MSDFSNLFADMEDGTFNSTAPVAAAPVAHNHDDHEHAHDMRGQFTSAHEAAMFALAGKATLTLRSKRTGVRYTFSINKVKDSDNRYFVGLLTGSDNTSDYSYVGLLDGGYNGYRFRLTAKSRLTAEAAPVKAFAYFTQQVLVQAMLPSSLEVFHEGRCGRCNRKLTVPESIANGIGPECARRVGV